MTELSNEGVQVVADQIAEEILRQKSQTSAIDAIMYLRKLVGTEFDETFHRIAKRLHSKKKTV